MAIENSGTLALLIDGDNVSSKIVVGLMPESLTEKELSEISQL
ncbi:hypothetical protein RJJ63_22650 [Rhizobium hidalgonense]|nr:hypothetical protein [Rhizobium hidalgonense]MDR9822057.1 hypothetical protein [Rhizobium hidalgonense]